MLVREGGTTETKVSAARAAAIPVMISESQCATGRGGAGWRAEREGKGRKENSKRREGKSG
jgi:hypothetical protein